MQQYDKVLITGIGVFSSLGEGVAAHLEKLLADKTGISVGMESEEGLTFFHAIPSEIPFSEYFRNLKPPYPQKYSQLAMIGCYLAMLDAGLPIPIAENAERTGLILNSSLGALESVESYFDKLYREGPSKVSPFLFTQTVANCALGDTARYFRLKGPSSLLLGECSIPYGFDLIRTGKADIILAGGFDQIRVSNPIWSMAKDKMILLESDLHGSEKCVYSDAIDSIRKKTIVGQASAFLVLEKASHALQRKARIYATLTDYSTCTDQLCNKIILEHHPDDYERSLQTLFERNGILPSAIDLFVGRSCLPWEIKNTELNVLYKLLQRESRLPIYTTAKCKMGKTYGSSGNWLQCMEP